VSTLVASFFVSRYLAQFQWLVCQRKDLTIRTWLECEPANTFRALPATETFAPLPTFVKRVVLAALPEGYTIMPLQLHALSFAVRQRNCVHLRACACHLTCLLPCPPLHSCLRRSSRRLAASSPPASSARCASRTSATPSPATAA
jgi:hypothetical protein